MTRAGLAGMVAAALFGCTIDPIDFTGKTCAASNECLDGYRCDLGSMTCTPLGGSDLGPSDAGPSDASLSDAGPGDAGLSDAGLSDAGPKDAGPKDAGPKDAGTNDAGPSDAGRSDAGPGDAGLSDAGLSDAGRSDAGPNGSCTPYKAGGCQAGQNCMYDSATQSFSCAKAGSTAAWYSCSAQSECAAGTACVDDGGDQHYFCKPFCQKEADCEPFTSAGVTSCTATNLYDGLTQITGVLFCAANARAHLLTTMRCVPYKAEGCPTGQNCMYDRALHNFVCEAAGTRKAWYACSAQSDCSAGTACVDNNGDKDYYCKPFCMSETDCEPYTTPGVTSCTLNLYDGNVQLRGAPFCAADHKAHLR